MDKEGSAEALMDRMHFKSYVPNWLDIDSQIALDRVVNDRLLFESLRDFGYADQVSDHPVFESQNPPFVDWALLRAYAIQWIRIDKEKYERAFYRFSTDMMSQVAQKASDEEQKHMQDPRRDPYQFIPTAISSTRSFIKASRIMQMSTFIDFLLSPIADDGNIETAMKQRAALQPSSIWRSHLILTTVGPGTSQLVQENGRFHVDFGWTETDLPPPRNRRDNFMRASVLDERGLFEEALSKELSNSEAKESDIELQMLEAR